jgi:hypothetical protein
VTLNPFSDLRRMAGLNEKVVLAAVGELECVDGKPIEIPEEERIGEAVLISMQLARMAGELEKRYSES